jgi:hypothetical protein
MAGDDERPAFFDDVLGHAVAHEAQADESDRFPAHTFLLDVQTIDSSAETVQNLQSETPEELIPR